MNKMKNTFFIVIVVTIYFSCEEPLEYKFQNREQLIDCHGVDNKLVHEALYSFEDDIASYYNNSLEPGFLNYDYGYARYIYKGALGEADYKKIVSNYSIKVLKRLLQEKELWNKTTGESKLNYNCEFVNCLINNIKNKDIKKTLLSNREVNSLNPKILADVYRRNIRDAHTDKYFAMFLALDTYYQYIIDIDFTEINTNE